ncbi:MAG TPA: threonine synthase, partial [Fibrella sp.]
MTFYSTNNSANIVSVPEALFNSLPQDKGLYMPTSIPQLPVGFMDGIAKQSLVEIAYKLTKLWLHEDLTNAQIEQLVTQAFPFDTPLVELEAGRKYVLELFHGPSLAFKDVGARFMAGLMSIYSATQSREV